MFLSTMNSEEVTKELMKDYQQVVTTSLQRLASEYERERRRNKIDKREEYKRIYTIKTGLKNNWVFIFCKDANFPAFKNLDSLRVYFFTYYLTNQGLRVFSVPQSREMIDVYNSHFFQRYNERMKLGFLTTLDIVKHFFINNPVSVVEEVERGEKPFVFSLYKEGIGFSEKQNNNRWLVHKTFINRELARKNQTELESKMLVYIEEELKIAKLRGEVDETKIEYLNILLSRKNEIN